MGSGVTAWANHAAGLSRANVVCDATTGQIIGYVTLSAGQIQAPRSSAEAWRVSLDRGSSGGFRK